MSQQQQQSRPIAQSIPDFGELYPRHVGGNHYRVLSTSEGQPTAYEVDIHELTCTCPDFAFNEEEPQVCKHLAATLFQAPGRIEIEDHLVNQLLELYENGVTPAQNGSTVDQGQATGGTTNADSGASDDDTGGSTPGRADPVGVMEDLLEARGLDPDDFAVYVDEEYGSLQIEKDGYLDDSEFAAWQELSEDLGLEYDQRNDRNYLKEADLGRLDEI